MLPLGSHRAPENPGVEVLDEAPIPKDFFYQYVQGSKPFLIKNHAKDMPAFKFWNDEYIRSKYGHLQVDVEQGKKENRSNYLWTMKLEEFLSKYNDSDIYLVNSLPREMMGDIWIIKSLLCGGFLDNLIDAVTWFSSGGTKSVFHFDALDNINCLFDGTKELILVPKMYAEHLDFDNPSGSYSSVDVDHVDMYKYPQFLDVPWYNVSMEPGDCLYIPYRWAHQVRSSGRNLAINIWFIHQHYFDEEDCKAKGDLPEFAVLSDFEIKDAEDLQTRSELISFVKLKGGVLTLADIEAAKTYFGAGEEELKALFEFMDQNNDNEVTEEEVASMDRVAFRDLANSFDSDRGADDSRETGDVKDMTGIKEEMEEDDDDNSDEDDDDDDYDDFDDDDYDDDDDDEKEEEEAEKESNEIYVKRKKHFIETNKSEL